MSSVRFVHYLFVALLGAGVHYAAVAEEKTEIELERVRSRIKDVQKQIDQARVETGQLRQELMESEIAAAGALTNLHNVKTQIEEQNVSIAGLVRQKSHYQKELTAKKQSLAEQLRVAYKIGRNDYVKLILNQEDPALVGRVLAYHNYHNRARITRINGVAKQLQDLADIERSIKRQTHALERLQSQHEKEIAQYSSFRDSRTEIIQRMREYIDQQDGELRTLRENERELAALLKQLSTEDPTTTEIFADTSPFGSLKGNLAWPVEGKLINHFGSPKRSGDLKWQGVVIDAESGTDIRTISAGKVVFADWFRNLGLLLIIDHGNDYMSLYGHNQNLLKKAGDWVRAGEIIATLGDSGGQTQPGLYFEIRKDGNPVDPIQWCRADNLAR